VQPWTTHAYILRRSTARFLASHYAYLLGRSGSPHADLKFYDEKIQASRPWQMSNWELNADFLLLTLHRFYYSGVNRRRTWFAFESTPEVPASYSPDGNAASGSDGAIETVLPVKCLIKRSLPALQIEWVENGAIEVLGVAEKEARRPGRRPFATTDGLTSFVPSCPAGGSALASGDMQQHAHRYAPAGSDGTPRECLCSGLGSPTRIAAALPMRRLHWAGGFRTYKAKDRRSHRCVRGSARVFVRARSLNRPRWTALTTSRRLRWATCKVARLYLARLIWLP
jgi:hypothetical protein